MKIFHKTVSSENNTASSHSDIDFTTLKKCVIPVHQVIYHTSCSNRFQIWEDESAHDPSAIN